MGQDIVIDGDHLCSIYQSAEQLFTQIIPYFIDSLRSNYKCLYIYDDNSREEILLKFSQVEFPLDEYLVSGQFMLLNKSETYLVDGKFDLAHMVELTEKIGKEALSQGYSGFRGAGEMTWMLDDINTNYEEYIEYESGLNSLFPNSKSATICMYNETKFNQETLINIIRTHPKLIVYGKQYNNKYFFSPPDYLRVNEKFPPNSYKTIISTILEE